MTDPNDQQLMRLAIQLARASVRAGGGPFGCVIARDGRPIAEGQNRVTLANDPTAHAEVVAIRAACTTLGSFQLDRCTIYTSCEPCPMCLGAIYWARAQRLVFACTRADAAAIGFDDDHIYREIARAPAARELQTESLLRDEALAAFRDWSSTPDRREY
ncbi:MAG TPA: nucleoside deaminase [Planctomycetota bacterium]|nr:nucleoside deaminase [Planctomycetota bacterium]